MINGNPNEFLEVVASGQNITYKFGGIIYWYQGYNKGDKFRMEIYRYIPLQKKGFTWECERDTYLDCYNEFVKAPIFDGKTFWEVEQEIEWVIGKMQGNVIPIDYISSRRVNRNGR